MYLDGGVMTLAMSQELLRNEVTFGLAALLCYMVFVCYLLPRMGFWYATGLGLLCPTLMVTVAVVAEERSLGQVLDWRHQSWAFLFGDFIVLVVALTLAAKLWQQLPTTYGSGRRLKKTFWRRRQWVAICLVLGALVALYIHERDVAGYAAAGAHASAFTPSKLVHDIFGSSIYAGTLALTVLPVLVVPLLPRYRGEEYDDHYACRYHWEHFVIASCIAIFAVLLALDGFRNLDPALLHPAQG